MEEDAPDIGLNKYLRLVACKSEDGARAVAADAGKFPQRRRVMWDFPLIFTNDYFCRFVEIEGAAIVTETLSHTQNIGKRRGRQCGNVRETLDKLTVLPHHARDLRLLEHHFGNKDMVGIARPAPREAPLMSAVVAPDSTYKFFLPFFFLCLHGAMIQVRPCKRKAPSYGLDKSGAGRCVG